jgi:hypothetical protein
MDELRMMPSLALLIALLTALLTTYAQAMPEVANAAKRALTRIQPITSNDHYVFNPAWIKALPNRPKK